MSSGACKEEWCWTGAGGCSWEKLSIWWSGPNTASTSTRSIKPRCSPWPDLILSLSINITQMHKVGVMMMFAMGESPKKVKEIILEVEGKTKISNILEYLLEMDKIQHTDY